MRRILSLLFTLSLIFVGSSTSAHDGEDHGTRVWDGSTKPSIELIVTKDMMSGFNVHIKTKGFKWAPQRASMTHRAGEGHAHIYVDGIKVGRVYSSWYHLNTAGLNLKPGNHTIKIDLNGNDHVPYTYLGKVLAKSVKVNF